MGHEKLTRSLGLALASLCFSKGLLGAQGTDVQATQHVDSSVQAHLRELMASLPLGNRIREALERGDRGRGVRYPWMDHMRREGVKRVRVRTEFVWRSEPTEVRVSRIVYFSKYEQDCAQISDPQRLSQIPASGLQQELGRVAIERTLKAHWLILDKGHPTKHGVSTVELLDDEWLPNLPDILTPAPEKPNRFREAAGTDDLAEVKSLLQAGVSPEERDSALWATLSEDDSCMTTSLLKAGANPNLRDQDGFTPLMAAVRYRAYRNVETLLAAGADVRAKAHNGQTAVSFAKLEHDAQMMELLARPGANY